MGRAVARLVWIATSAAVALAAAPGCATRQSVRTVARAADDRGIPRCPAGAADALLSVNALQCWFDAAHGRWRTISQESHYDVLVVEVEAEDLRDADEIGRRFVAGERSRFSEILVYAQAESEAAAQRIRRVRWTREGGFEALEFSGQPMR